MSETDAAAPLTRHAALREPDIASAMLQLQWTAGNRAAVRAMQPDAAGRTVSPRQLARLSRSASSTAARHTPARAGKLTSPRFQDEPLLEDCFEDRARMGVGSSDTSSEHPVSKVQQALLDWGVMRGISVDLGTTGPIGNGVDGVYGAKTAAAVKLFKATEHLGFEEFGDVGPGTMHRLDTLFSAAHTPPSPGPPAPPAPEPPGPGPVRAPLPPRPAPAPSRKVTKGCFAPSEVVNVINRQPIGAVAEKIIEDDYLSRLGGKAFADVFLDNPVGPMSYVAFLKSHHPTINVPLLAAQIALSGGVLVPDLLDTRLLRRSDPEFYDVKPNSIDGRPAGRAKLAAIDAFMSANSLPYVRGDSYTPPPSIPLPLTSAALAAAIVAVGGPAALPLIVSCGLPKVSLEVRRLSRGLLVYRVCVEADFECYVKVIALEFLLAAIIVAILIILTGRIPASESLTHAGAAEVAPAGTHPDPALARPGPRTGVGRS